MSELEAQLRTALTADASLIAETSTRIYFQQAPQSPTFPCLIYYYTIIESDSLDDSSYKALVQIDILGQGDDISTVRPLLRSAMKAATGFKVVAAKCPSYTSYDDDLDIDRDVNDFDVTYNL